MRWSSQTSIGSGQGVLPGLGPGEIAAVPGHLRTVRSPQFRGIVFHEVLAKSVLNPVSPAARMPFRWSVNPYRGCSHACVYCFARAFHRYLDLDTGEDFNSQIIVKTNVAQVLHTELAHPQWRRELVALGTNTDPYQRAEGRYRLMPAIIEELSSSGTPFSILTKGTLVRRDLAQIAKARRRSRISLSLSIAINDPVLQQAVEPGTPTTAARLETIAAARSHGIPVTVFLMPIMPYLNDSTKDLLQLLRNIKEAGAASVLYAPLHLRPHIKPWFMQWLGREHQELVATYETLYPGRRSQVCEEYRQQLSVRIRPLIEHFGLGKPERAVAPPPPTSAVPDVGVTTLF